MDGGTSVKTIVYNTKKDSKGKKKKGKREEKREREREKKGEEIQQQKGGIQHS